MRTKKEKKTKINFNASEIKMRFKIPTQVSSSDSAFFFVKTKKKHKLSF
jgi:hypothetical protein